MAMPPAAKRYSRRVLILMTAYAVLLLAVVFAFTHQMVSGPVAYLAAILPALPLIGVFAAIGAYLVEEQDEYVRMLMIRQTLYASAFALSIATIWGFLEGFQLVRHVEAYYIATLWFGGFGLGAVINRLTIGRRA